MQGTRASSPSFERVAGFAQQSIPPELETEANLRALLPYGVLARILNGVPLDNATSITSWRRRIGRIGERLG